MKTTKAILAFSMIVMMLTSCGKGLSPEEEGVGTGQGFAAPVIRYWVGISFTDSDGNDLTTPLISGSGDRNPLFANPEKYNLAILLADGSKQDVENMEYFQMYNHFGNGGRYYLFNDFFMYSADLQKELTYRIKSQTIFGDDAEHEIVTYWIDDPDVAYKKDPEHVYDADDHRIMQQTPQCTSATIAGKAVTVNKAVLGQDINGKDYYTYLIDIVLDR